MTRWIVVALLALGPMSTALASDTGDAKGCTMTGAWIQYDAMTGKAAWLGIVAAQSASSGTMLIDYPGLDPTVGGLVPTAVKTTTLQGLWERATGNTFFVTFVVLSVDESGAAVGIGKIRSLEILSDDCNVLNVTRSTLELFQPSQNPFVDEPWVTIPLANHSVYRMRVDPPLAP